MFLIFGDESHDERQQRVFAVAALFGSQEQWDKLRAAWLARTGDIVFHAAECETVYARSADRSKHQENLRLYADLAKILADSQLLGFGVGIDLAGYRAAFPDDISDIPYYIGFRKVIEQCAEWTYLSIPRGTARVTFDRNHKVEYNAATIYSYFANAPELDWKYGQYLEKRLAFTTRDEVGIQAADLLARETMKHLDNMIGPIERPMRRSLETLRATKRFGFDYLMKEYFVDYRSKIATLEQVTDMKKEEYRAWLSKNHAVDNMSSRMKYLQELDDLAAKTH